MDTVLELDPADARVRNNRGCELQESGDLALAIAEHSRAIELDPNNRRLLEES